MSPRSVKRRQLIFAAATILITLLAAGGALVLLFENHLLKRVEQELDMRWTELSKAVAVDGKGTLFIRHEPADPRYEVPLGSAYWQVSEHGKPILRSKSLADNVLSTESVSLATKQAGAFEIDTPSDGELYVVEREVSIGEGPALRRFTLTVATGHLEVKEFRHAFALDVAKVLAIIMLILVAGGWLQLRFGLAPLLALRGTLADVREGRSQRLTGKFPEEVQPLVDDLNTLLNRQEGLVKKARNRAGSLAHGLKTPLTVLSGEIARLERAGQAETAKVLKVQFDAIRGHVERELARARTHGAIPSYGLRTSILPILQRLVDLMRRAGNGRDFEWRIDVDPTVTASMESDDFAEVIGNLLDNARKWATHSVHIRIEDNDGKRFLSITDDGPGVPTVFQRDILRPGVHFGRDGDESTGLGLALVRDTLAEYEVEPQFVRTHQSFSVRFQIGATPSTP